MSEVYSFKVGKNGEYEFFTWDPDKIIRGPMYVPIVNSSKKEHQPGMFELYRNYNGAYCHKEVYIKEVIYNNPATIVFWSDDTKTVAKCDKEDTYSKEFGLTLCIIKKLVGGAKVYNILDKWVSESNRVTLKDVRKDSRRR